MKKLILGISLTILFCLALSCQKQATEETPAGITEAEAQNIVEHMLEIYNQGNLALVDEIFAPEYVRHDSALPEDIQGLEAFKAYVTSLRTAYPDFTVSVDEQIIKGYKIISRWTVSGTNTGPLQSPMGELPPTGKKMIIPGAEIVQIANGKITEEWLFYNQLSSYLQMGYTLAPPQPPEEK